MQKATGMEIETGAKQLAREKEIAVADSLKTTVKAKGWAVSHLKASGLQKDGGSGSLVS